MSNDHGPNENRSEAESRLVAIIESSDDAIVSKTLDGIITSWNRSAERIFGWTSDEVIGKPISIIIPEDRAEEETHILAKLRRGERVDHFETIRRTKDGRLINISVTISPVRGPDGRIVGVSKVARDITLQKEYQAKIARAEEEREQLLQSERAARNEAETTSRMKDEFLATLSHELRTPMSAILGWSQVLRRNPTQEGLEEGLATIERNAKAQTRIIEDLLDMSRIISGKIRLEVQRLELASVINAAIETVRHGAETKGVRMQSVLDPSAGIVSGDPNRLQQVFWNLLTNAIKFTPKGGRVQIVLERVNSHVEVSVIDTGEGIKPDFLPFVFDRFRQSDASTTRTHGGLGLGLSIVKQLVQLHGGEVRVKSAGEGKGATFIVALPLTILHPLSHPESDRRHPRGQSRSPLDADFDARLAGARILIVDDEADARSLAWRLLSDAGAIVLTAASAREAVELVERERPDILVSDIGMPIEDGYSLIDRVRKLGSEKGGELPAVALTAYARTEDRVRALHSGFQTHVTKPVDPAELVAVVASLLRPR